MTTTGPGSATRAYADLDAASAERLHPAAAEVLRSALEHGYADPRRLHGPARNARLLLDNAREVVASCLGVRRDEVTFTASGTEAVHRGLTGLVHGRAGRHEPPGPVVHSAVEHHSVLHAAQWCRTWLGTEVQAVGVDAYGRVQVAELDEAVRARGAAVVALQSANHEVGTVQPVAPVAEALAALATPPPLFVDACASLGRLDLPAGWAVAAGSAHKWGGPAGVGLLLVRKGTRWASAFPGDDRVDDRSTGFENVPAALAAAAALQAVLAERDAEAARQRDLVDLVRARVATIPDVDVVGDPDDRLPHLVTFSCLYVDGEALVTELDRLGFGVASGSACTASTLEPSHVLAAMGALTHGNLRLSVSRDATREQVERFLDVLPGTVARIRAEAGI